MQGHTPTRPRAAAVAILIGMASLGLVDNFVPLLAEEGGLWQFHALRSAICVGILVVAGALGMGRLRPRSLRHVAGRSFLVATAMVIYFACLALMPIGHVLAGLFTAPVFVLLITRFGLKRPVGPMRWGAAGLGFLGTLLVIQPDPANLDPLIFLPVAAGAFYGAGAVATRHWCEEEGTLALMTGFFAALGIYGVLGIAALALWPLEPAAGAAGFAMRGWVPVTGPFLFWTLVQTVGSILGMGMIIRGYQLGEVSRVAIYEYSVLVFASFWAWVFFAQTVGALQALGMVVIAAAGSIVAIRSAKA
ncbi:DMT family transporter [Alphaproteobacteria bacterium KMM 3653]|uniref:DMT family transporter n=1 Tax=Harenicola maris TaxID=2841044 RepID=A0AAP2G4R9_9RHOB|nr:DMT family transporter [Harenicola maris]